MPQTDTDRSIDVLHLVRLGVGVIAPHASQRLDQKADQQLHMSFGVWLL